MKKPGGYVAMPVDTAALATGQAKINVDIKDVLAVRVYNATQADVGLALTIDGINVFAFSQVPEWKALGKMVIHPGKSTIFGWNHDPNVSHEFAVSNYGDSAAGRLGAVDGLGTITATFVEIVPAKGVDDIGIGVGEKVQAKYNAVAAGFGKPVAAVSVQYTRPSFPVDLPTDTDPGAAKP